MLKPEEPPRPTPFAALLKFLRDRRGKIPNADDLCNEVSEWRPENVDRKTATTQVMIWLMDLPDHENILKDLDGLPTLHSLDEASTNAAWVPAVGDFARRRSLASENGHVMSASIYGAIHALSPGMALLQVQTGLAVLTV